MEERLQCIRHDITNSIKPVKKILKSLRPNKLKSISSIPSIVVFIPKKFKLTSKYPHQIYSKLMASVKTHYPTHVPFVQSLLRSMVQGRGQRMMNILKNCGPSIFLRDYVAPLLQTKINYNWLFSSKLRPTMIAFCKSKTLEKEMTSLFYLYKCLYMEIVMFSGTDSYESLGNAGLHEIIQCISDLNEPYIDYNLKEIDIYSNEINEILNDNGDNDNNDSDSSI
eukprot:458293_1